MKRETISQGVGNIDVRYIQEAADCLIKPENVHGVSGFRRSRYFVRGIAAALLVLCVLVRGVIALLNDNHVSVTVYAQGTDEEITAAGAVLHTGSISDTGKMKGHPLMFYLAGEDIASVRFSCKEQWISFMDWTEKRDEYGNAQNFTVVYGEDESEYRYLTIVWVPNRTIRELTDNGDSSIAALPEDMRKDIIVLEIAFKNGKTVTKAITVSLQDDGTFFAALDDYSISEADAFVRRPDSEAIPRSILYAQGDMATGSSADAAPMVCVGGRLYQRSTDQKVPYEGPEDGFVYLGRIESDITDDQGAAAGVPKENFQANHPIVGAEIYRHGEDMMVRISGEYWLYEAVDNGTIQDMQYRMFENVGGIACWGITLRAENVTSAGLTLICTQSGGLPTGELETGRFYKLAVRNKDTWEEVPCLIEDVVWKQEAYSIPSEDTVVWEINWEALYGKLEAGTYRIMKRIDDFRKAGDYDTAECWAEFEIKPQEEAPLTAEQIEEAKQAALAYYEGTVFSVNSIEYTEDQLPYGAAGGGCGFKVNVSKGGVVQEPDRWIVLQLEDGRWQVMNEGY